MTCLALSQTRVLTSKKFKKIVQNTEEGEIYNISLHCRGQHQFKGSVSQNYQPLFCHESNPAGPHDKQDKMFSKSVSNS